MPSRLQPSRWSLGAWLALAFVLLSIVLTAVLTVASERTAATQLRSHIGSGLAELAHQTTTRLDREMYERFREVELIAQRLGRESDPARIRAELDNLQRSYPTYAWIGATDLSGKVVAATRGMLEGVDVSKRPWFINVQSGRHLGDVHEAVLLARLLGAPGAEPMRFVDIAFALQDREGRPWGVLGAHLSWEWAKEVRQAIFVPVGRTQTAEPLIVSAEGVVLLGPDGLVGQRLAVGSLARAAAGAPGWQEESWPDGRRYLVGHALTRGYLGYPGLGWAVLVRQELDEAYAPVRALQHRQLAWGVAAAAVFSLLGWLAARAITRPLLALSRSARRLEAGEQRSVDTSRAYSEVAGLGQALNSLVGNLQRKESDLRELNASLERRVEERTAELREAFERVRENEQRIETIIETAQDPFVGMDLHGRITDWNSQAEKLFGWSREEVLGRTLAQTLVPARYAGTTAQALQQYLATGEAAFAGRTLERLMVDRHGREIPVEVKIGLVDTGRQRFFSAFVHDISARKEVERIKDEFISTVSHELRTPMTAIYGSLSLLQSGMAGELPPPAQDLVNMSAQSCERLIRLVNDVLDVEKIQSGRMDYAMRVQPLRPLVEQALRDTQAFAQRLGVTLRLADGPDATVRADADRIVQVVVNLLSNAAKYSPAGGEVVVAVTLLQERVRVAVVDHGPGVPEGFRERAFERFVQADSSDRRQKGGTGLGLNICRSIVQAHGGTIDFTSEPGVRTEFFFKLPLAAA